ncbi:ABC transporter permease [Falsiroseomonas sp. HW251]|uniref:ABC transporter permease n=1 Tax=Falsiroseomonas sp. HW251 TaxID=3390998 RepID=UPI003D3164D2
MLAYILRRLVSLVLTLVGLSMVVFAIARLLPGDPARLAAGPNASPAEVEAIVRQFGLDRPIWEQYLTYAGGLLRGDWGTSILNRRPVAEELAAYLPATLELVIAALLIAVLVGIPAGLISGVYANRWPDTVSRTVSLGLVSMPRFFLGLLLQLGFAMWLGVLPLGGRFPVTEPPPDHVIGFFTVDALLTGDWEGFVIALRHLILPAAALSLSPLATITRMMRAATVEALQQDWVLTERALGLSPALIVGKYVLRNAASSSLTVIGLYVGWLLGGTVLVETVFDWPGIGLYATRSITTQDFAPIVGVTLVVGAIFISVNLMVDLLYGVLNPKVRTG